MSELLSKPKISDAEPSSPAADAFCNHALAPLYGDVRQLPERIDADLAHPGLLELPPDQAVILREALTALRDLLSVQPIAVQLENMRQVLVLHSKEYRTDADEAETKQEHPFAPIVATKLAILDELDQFLQELSGLTDGEELDPELADRARHLAVDQIAQQFPRLSKRVDRSDQQQLFDFFSSFSQNLYQAGSTREAKLIVERMSSELIVIMSEIARAEIAVFASGQIVIDKEGNRYLVLFVVSPDQDNQTKQIRQLLGLDGKIIIDLGKDPSKDLGLKLSQDLNDYAFMAMQLEKYFDVGSNHKDSDELQQIEAAFKPLSRSKDLLRLLSTKDSLFPGEVPGYIRHKLGENLNHQ